MPRSGPLLLLVAALAAGSACSDAAVTVYDIDGDGYPDQDDCGVTDPSIHPGAPDPIGDSVDQNCDGADGVDLDGDGWGFGVGADCNDQDANIHPGATDLEGDGVDADCDGVDGVLDVGDDDDSAGDDDDSSLCGLPPNAHDFGPAVGQFLTDIDVQRADGSISSIYELCGRVTLLDVDAMWNAPGIQVQSTMQALYQEYNSSGLEVATILISGDSPGIPPTLGQLEDWATDHDLSFPVVMGEEAVVVANLLETETSGSFGIPYLIVLDSNLRIHGTQTGSEEPALWALVEAALEGS